MEKINFIAIISIVLTLSTGYAISESYIVINQESGQTTNPLRLNNPSGTEILNINTKGTLTSLGIEFSGDGFHTGNMPDFLIYKNVTHVIAINTTTNKIFSDDTLANASVVFQAVFDEVETNNGGWLHVKGYGIDNSYKINTALALPETGRFKLTGDGANLTAFQVKAPADNNIFEYIGNPTTDQGFYYFSDFRMKGNPTGSSNSGFYFETTGTTGLIDSIFTNLYITDFAVDGIFANKESIWNNKFTYSTFELSGRTNLNLESGTHVVIHGNKFLYNKGQPSLVYQGGWGMITENFFFGNDRGAIVLNSTGDGNVISNNVFYQNSDTVDDTYYEIHIDDGDGNVISNNVMFGSAQTNKPKYAILIDSGSHNNTITGNNFNSNGGISFFSGGVPVLDNDGDNIIRNNAGFIGVGDTQWKYKTTDTSRVNNTPLDDEDIQGFKVDPNSVYALEGFIHVTTDEVTADYKHGFTFPAGATSKCADIMAGFTDEQVTRSCDVIAIGITSTADEFHWSIQGYIYTDTAGGVADYQWSQALTDAGNPTTLKKGSWVSITKIG